MRLGEIRKVISKMDLISICFKDTLSYSNYKCIDSVPDNYDDIEVYGIGVTESDFLVEPIDIALSQSELMKHSSIGLYYLSDQLEHFSEEELLITKIPKKCIEIVLYGLDPVRLKCEK